MNPQRSKRRVVLHLFYLITGTSGFLSNTCSTPNHIQQLQLQLQLHPRYKMDLHAFHNHHNHHHRPNKNNYNSPLDQSIQETNWSPPPGIKFAGVRHRKNTQSSSSTALPVSSVGGAVMPDGGLSPCIIKVVGVGGGGSNAVDRMMDTRVGAGVEFWAVNTDAQALGRSKARGAKVLNIGNTVTRGLGAGGNPQVGENAATESKKEIAAMLSGSDLVFVTSGMGGGTGSGAAPVVAEVAKDVGALTIGIVTKPFDFEGRRRMKQALNAIDRLKENVDTVIVVSNNKLLEIIPEDTPIERAFAVADDILRQGVVGIADIIIKPGMVNVDFADVRTVMQNAGTALMGIGIGNGKTRAEDAALAAISSPLLDTTIDHATGVVFNLSGGPNMSLAEVSRAAKMIYDNVETDANVIFGALIDESMGESVSMTVLATGFKPMESYESIDQSRSIAEAKIKESLNDVVNTGLLDKTPKKQQQQSQRVSKMKNPPPKEVSKKSNKDSPDVPDFLKQLKRKN